MGTNFNAGIILLLLVGANFRGMDLVIGAKVAITPLEHRIAS